ncbi:N-acetyltransferase [Paenibacillus sp. 32352]|uniref:GNAT family N-acetyltransferase n=1 Tax=Paenibacillus sp. 32352 TaxID=1969111 RepID=UPI0009AC6664|nr:GNAT family N-acetyltransferase [Paenibacillus sp. 32352]
MELYLSQEIDSEGKAWVRNKLIEFNWRHFPAELRNRYQEVNLFLKDGEDHILGGLVGEVCWNWLEVHYVFVEEAYRRSGYGKQLLDQAERMAQEKQCDFIKLDTLSFQALGFYQKLGFDIYGTIPNAGGHTHYYLKKDLTC